MTPETERAVDKLLEKYFGLTPAILDACDIDARCTHFKKDLLALLAKERMKAAEIARHACDDWEDSAGIAKNICRAVANLIEKQAERGK